MRQAPQGNGSAERAFLEGRIEEATLLWKSALADPHTEHHGAIEFNLGLAALKLGREAEALWHFRRAELRLPGQQAITEQRAQAEEALALPAHDAEANPLNASTAWLLLILAALLEATSAVLFCSRRTRTTLRWCMLLLTALLGIGMGAYVLADGCQRAERVAVVLEATGVHSEPGLSAPVLQNLRPGTSVRVIAATNRWARIVTPLGTGFVSRSRIGLVD